MIGGRSIIQTVLSVVITSIIALATAPVADAQSPYAKYGRKPDAMIFNHLFDCDTRNEEVISSRSGIPQEVLQEYRNRKDKSLPIKDRYLAFIHAKISADRKRSTIAFPFNQVFECKYMENGHSLTSRQVCGLMSNGFPGSRFKRLDNGGSYCVDSENGGGIAVLPWLVCERYAEKKLGLQIDQTATFARWNGATHEAVCFYLNSVDIEARFAQSNTRLKREINRDMFKKIKRVYFGNSAKDQDVETALKEIHGRDDILFEIQINHVTPLVGSALVKLAKVDPGLAKKYIEHLRWGNNPDYKPSHYTPRERKNIFTGLGRTAHEHNAKVFKSVLSDVTKDRKLQSSRVKLEYDNYTRQKNPTVKQAARKSYEHSTKRLDALKKLELAVDELALINKEKEILEQLEQIKQHGKRRKGFEVSVGIATHKFIVTAKTESLWAELRKTQQRKNIVQDRIAGKR